MRRCQRFVLDSGKYLCTVFLSKTYLKRAKNIKNKPKVNRELSAKELQKLLDKAKEEIKDLKNYITGLEEELKIYKKGGIKSTTPIPMVDTESNSSTTSDSEMKRQELEAKLNEILPTISRYRGKS